MICNRSLFEQSANDGAAHLAPSQSREVNEKIRLHASVTQVEEKWLEEGGNPRKIFLPVPSSWFHGDQMRPAG